jgi:hypothetical protein
MKMKVSEKHLDKAVERLAEIEAMQQRIYTPAFNRLIELIRESQREKEAEYTSKIAIKISKILEGESNNDNLIALAFNLAFVISLEPSMQKTLDVLKKSTDREISDDTGRYIG